MPSVVAFLTSTGVATLAPIRIRRWRCRARSMPKCLPTSILYDAEGKEVWRYVGDLDWTSAEAAKLLAEAGAPPKAG